MCSWEPYASSSSCARALWRQIGQCCGLCGAQDGKKHAARLDLCWAGVGIHGDRCGRGGGSRQSRVDMAGSCVWHDSVMYVTWCHVIFWHRCCCGGSDFVCVCAMLMFVTRRDHVWYDSFNYVIWLGIHQHGCCYGGGTWQFCVCMCHVYTCDMT